MTYIPIIFEYQVADSWRHKFDLWRHRGDTASSISTIQPKYSTEMHQNTSFYAELNGQHAGEGFMPLRSIILEIRTRETKKSRIFRKFDLWPVITDASFGNAKGGRTNPPCPTEGGETPYPGEGWLSILEIRGVGFWPAMGVLPHCTLKGLSIDQTTLSFLVENIFSTRVQIWQLHTNKVNCLMLELISSDAYLQLGL